MKYSIDKTKYRVVDLTPQETEELNNKGWLFNSELDILILKDKENTFAIFKNIKHRVVKTFVLYMNK